jgi:hypothetical protein
MTKLVNKKHEEDQSIRIDKLEDRITPLETRISALENRIGSVENRKILKGKSKKQL